MSVGRTTAICKVLKSNTCKSSDWQCHLLQFKLPYFGLAILLLAQYLNYRVYKQLEDIVNMPKLSMITAEKISIMASRLAN